MEERVKRLVKDMELFQSWHEGRDSTREDFPKSEKLWEVPINVQGYSVSGIAIVPNSVLIFVKLGARTNVLRGPQLHGVLSEKIIVLVLGVGMVGIGLVGTD